MKKFWSLVTVLIILSMLLVACAPKATEAPKEQPKAEEPKAAEPTKAPEQPKAEEPTAVPPVAGEPVKIIIFVGFGTGTSPEQQAVHAQIQEEFNASHTDLQIEFLTVPWAERITKFSTMLAGDLAPDIVMPIGVGGIAEFYDEWIDLTPYIQRDNFDMTRFAGKTVEVHNYGDKGVLGLPMCVYPTTVYYNADIFDAAGVDYPPHEWEAPYADGEAWTYMKLVEVAKKLTLDVNGNDANSPAFDPTNIKQFGWSGWDWNNAFDVAVKFGAPNGKGVSNDNKTAILTTQPYVDAFTWIKDTVWTWHIRATSEQAGAFYDKAGDPLGSGLVGMWEIHTWMSYAWSGWQQSFNWDMAADPAWPPQKPIAIVDADTFVMPKASKNSDAAWEVVKWFYEPANLSKLIKNYGCLPADTELLAKWKGERTAEYPNVDFQVVVDAMDYTEGSPNHEAWRPAYTKINDAINKMNESLFTGTNTDVNALLGATNTEIQALLDEYWASQ